MLPQCDGLFQPVEAPGEDGRLTYDVGIGGVQRQRDLEMPRRSGQVRIEVHRNGTEVGVRGPVLGVECQRLVGGLSRTAGGLVGSRPRVPPG